jgi:tripartite-type tricarboxylate transporter receptor subunit TctC
MRLLATEMSRQTGWTVIVENKSGAEGSIAADIVAKSAPDGHTFLVTPSGLLLLPFVKKSLPYDTLKDLTPVTILTRAPSFVATSATLPVKNLRELLAMVRSTPAKYTYPTADAWGQLGSVRFNRVAGIEGVRIPYRGSAALMPDLANGLVTFGIVSVSTAKPYLDSGRLRALCVTSDKRMHPFNDVPTCSEEGVKYVSFYRHEVYAPARTPTATIERVQKALASVLGTPQVLSGLGSRLVQPVGNSAAEFAAELPALYKELEKSSREAGLIPE